MTPPPGNENPSCPVESDSKPAEPRELKIGDAAKAKSDSPAGQRGEKVEQLTPEEQMKRFEQALKEEDWGHQPC